MSATAKHFAGNNSELDRHHSSSDIDERTLRELYLPGFEAAVREAKLGAIMSAYNLVSGVHATEHDRLNNQIAKREWGFDGILMSDWHATYDAVAAANGGLDLEMPAGEFMNRASLGAVFRSGPAARAGDRHRGHGPAQERRQSAAARPGQADLGGAHRPGRLPGRAGRRRQRAGATLRRGQLPRGAVTPPGGAGERALGARALAARRDLRQQHLRHRAHGRRPGIAR